MNSRCPSMTQQICVAKETTSSLKENSRIVRECASLTLESLTKDTWTPLMLMAMFPDRKPPQADGIRDHIPRDGAFPSRSPLFPVRVDRRRDVAFGTSGLTGHSLRWIRNTARLMFRSENPR